MADDSYPNGELCHEESPAPLAPPAQKFCPRRYSPSSQALESRVILSNILLQILQVLCVLLLAPLLQGFILKVEERVQRSRGPSLFQPYRDLWKLFHKESVAPESASWIYFTAPIVALKPDFRAGLDEPAHRRQTQLLCIVHADVHYPA